MRVLIGERILERHATLDRGFILVLVEITSCTHHLIATTNEDPHPTLETGPRDVSHTRRTSLSYRVFMCVSWLFIASLMFIVC